MKKTTEKNRIFEIDLLRGIAILFMIFDHIMFDLWGVLPLVFKDYPLKGYSSEIYTFAVNYWIWDFREFFRYIVVFVFLGLVGVCASFSKNNMKRGKSLLMIAMIITVGSLAFCVSSGTYDNVILFGTLHCIALSLIIVDLLNRVVKKDYYYLIIGALMMVVGAYFELTYKLVFISDSMSILDVCKVVLGQFIGVYECGGDTMPILFNGGQILVGVYLGKVLYKSRKSIFNKEYSSNIITYFGRNSLVIYFLHQIILPIFLSLILLVLGFKLAI